MTPRGWLRPSHGPVPPTARLFCLPYAGAGSTVYRGWRRALAPEIDLVAVQPPGREDRLGEPPVETLAELVAGAADAVEPHLDLPFALYGHSLGALAAFELAHELAGRGTAQPSLLAVSGHRAPHLPRRVFLRDWSDDGLAAHLRKLGGPGGSLLTSEYVALFLPAVRADFGIAYGYRYEPRPTLELPIQAFGGTEDRSVTPAELVGWSALTTGEFAATLLPGDHFFLHAHAAVLARAVSTRLLRAGIGSSTRR